MSFEQKLQNYLDHNGLKSTKQRKVILDVFLNLGRHCSLEQLLGAVQKVMPQIGLATIYRTMRLFVEAKIAHEHRFEDGLMRYEPYHEGEHHDHLICTLCGKILEFEDDIIEQRQQVVAKSHGMRIISHTLEIYGVCENVETCENYDHKNKTPVI